MKIFKIVFGVLFVVLVSKCADHHVEHRAETSVLSGNSEMKISKNDVTLNNTKLSPSSDNSSITPASRDPSQELEQTLGAGVTKTASVNTVKNNQTADLPSSLNNTQVFPGNNNTSSFLRKGNSSIVEQQNPVHTGVASNSSTDGSQVPYAFPTVNNTRIPIVDYLNQTTLLLKNRTSEDTKSKSDVEINKKQIVNWEEFDNLNKTIRDKVSALSEQHPEYSMQHPLGPLEPEPIQDKFNGETESFEDGKLTEDELRRHKEKSILVSADQPDGMDQRYLAPIIVFSLVAASVLCYAALLVWRRYLESRYGSRTMLVNEDDFDDENDMRHFSI